MTKNKDSEKRLESDVKYKRGKNPNSLKNLKPTKKGEIKNPEGKPAGTLDTQTIINDILSGVEDHPEYGRLPRKALMFISLAKKAIQEGNVQCANLLLDRSDGPVKQTVVNENKEPMKIIVENAAQKKIIEDL